MFLTNIKVRNLLVGLMAAMMLTSLCACSRIADTGEATKPSEVTSPTENIVYDSVDFFSVMNFYLEYTERSSYSSQGANRELVHFEQDWLREILLRQEDYTTSFEILEVKKLSDQLWVINAYITSAGTPEGLFCDHFVGVIEGKLFVMINEKNIPPELKEGLDLTEYQKEYFYE